MFLNCNIIGSRLFVKKKNSLDKVIITVLPVEKLVGNVDNYLKLNYILKLCKRFTI